jgi:putative pyruvate formate lyase activating enzyme
VIEYPPKYLDTYQSGLFPSRLEQARKSLENCRVCPRNCGVNRLEGELGECQVGCEPIISSYFAHFGEESPLVGKHGSGTIFMAGCNLQCLYCQNYETSHFVEGRTASIRQLATMMLGLQENGCHNINIVTPSHVVPQLVESLHLAIEAGLNIPLVYNSGGYDSLKCLNLLDGLVDIYMPDFKFFSDSLAHRYLAVDNYATICKSALKEMHAQVGDLVIENGLAVKGLLIRHLVMPDQLEESQYILKFIAKEISLNSYLNIMPQYRPAGRAHQYEEINRALSYDEFHAVIDMARQMGFTRLDKY